MNDLTFATIGNRFLAHLIDGLIIFFGFCFIIGTLFSVGALGFSLADLKDKDALTSLLMIALVPLIFVGLASPIIYETVMLSSKQQATPGKMIMQIKVVQENGEPLTFGSALGRTLVKRISLTICGLLAFWPLFNMAHQALHDLAVKTYVVNK